MKKHILIIIFVFLLFTETTEAQKNHIEFNVSPYSLLDPTHPQFRVGSEICLFNFLLIGSDFGIGFTPNFKLVSFLTYKKLKKYNFYQIRPSIKFIVSSGKKYNFYFGFEYFYMQENDIILDDYFYPDFYNAITFSEADYFRQKEGLHFILGSKVFDKQKFRLDVYGGIGMARKYAYFSNPKNAIYSSFHHIVSYYGNIFYGYSEIPHITMNFKIYWQLDFNKRKKVKARK